MKTNNMKKILIVLLVCCLTAVCAITTLAAEPIASGTCGENLTWTLDDTGTLTISGTGDMTDYTVMRDIPWYSNRDSITSVVIEEGVTFIGEYVFYDCSNLTGIWVAESNPNYASDDRGVLFNKDMTTLLKAPNAISGSYSMPDTVTVITEHAFEWCQSLETITLSDSLTNIEYHAFWECSSLTSITIPETVESIGASAFSYCTSLTGIWVDENNPKYYSDESGVLYNKYTGKLMQAPAMLSGDYTINDGVRSVDSYAFAECSGLTGISIPDSVTNLGSFTFYNCTGLTSVQLPSQITFLGSAMFENCTGLTSVTLPNQLADIGSSAFVNCTSLTNITFPDTLTNIDYGAFSGCSGLTEIVLPENITSIEGKVFEGCASLTNITLPENVTAIGYSAFEGCASLTDITIPKNVTTIGDSTFKDCAGLISITLPDNLTAIEYGTFQNCASLTDITIPENVTTIESYAFAGCTSLMSITIPESVTTIGMCAFNDCTSLTDVTLSDQLTDLGFGAFEDCASLTDIIIPENVTTIESYTFAGCTSLTGITIPEGLTDVGYATFGNCDALTDVFYMGTVIQRGAISVDYTNQSFTLTQWHYEVEVWEQDGETVLYCPECALLYNPDRTVYGTPNNIVASDADMTWMLDDAGTLIILENSAAEASPIPWEAYYSSIVRVVFGSRVTVGSYFGYCENLKEFLVDNSNPAFCNDKRGVLFDKAMTTLNQAPRAISGGYAIPGGVTAINPRAFEDCTGLTNIDIPDTVTSIGDSAFYGCDGLTEVSIPEGVAGTGQYTFYECTGLTTVSLPDSLTSIGNSAFYGCTSLKNINFSDSIAIIGPEAFFGCRSLTEIDLPDGLTNLGLYAFGGCSGLTEVTIPGSTTVIGPFVFSNCTNLTAIWVDESNPAWSSDKFGVLYDKDKTILVKAPDAFAGYYTIPNTVTSITIDAFMGCTGLSGLTVPDSVTYIDECVVSDSSAVTVVHYTGTEEQKNAIEIKGYYMNALPWHCGVTVSDVAGQAVYYCPECDVKFLADGSAYYGVIVGGVSVTPDNCGDIFGDGTASYDFDTKTLTLNNADFTVTDQAYGIFAEDDLTISLDGNNTVTVANPAGDMPVLAGIYAGSDLKVCGEGKLLVYMDGNAEEKVYGIRVLGAMTLEARVTVDGSYEITTPSCGVHADIIYANAPELICYCETAITVDTGIYVTEKLRVYNAAEGFTEGIPCTLTSPVPGEWPVTIGYKPYWISFNGIDITSENADDIMGDGTVYYDEETDTITLNNANHTISGIGGGYWPGTMSINLNVIGENHLTIEDSNFIYTHDGHVSISGSGSLYLDIVSDFEFGAYGIYASYVSVSVDRLDINIDYNCENPYEDEYDSVVAAGIYTPQLKLSGRELNIDVTSNLDAYGIFLYGGEYTEGMKNQCTDVSIQTTTTNPEEYTATAIHAFAPFVVDGGRMELMGHTAIDALYPITLPEGYVVENAAEEFVSGTTTMLTQADPDVPVVIAPKPAVVPTLTGTSFSLSFEDEILVNFYYTAENTEDVTEQGMLVFYTDPGTADFAKADDVYTGSATDGTVFMNATRGIAAKYMGDERYYCAYAKLSDGTYAYSPLYSYSPEKYAMGRIANSSNEKLKSLCVAMLNYGAAAQKYFGYRTDDLMNEGLTAEQQALVTGFDIALFEGAIPADATKTVNFLRTETGFTKRNASVSFEGAFAINYYFTPEFAVAGDMTLYVWDLETYESVESLTADNAAAKVMTNQDGTWFAAVGGIAPKELDKTFYVAGVYTDAEGNTYCTGVIAYSLSRYCMNNANGNMGDLAQSTAMYGYYADQYFA